MATRETAMPETPNGFFVGATELAKFLIDQGKNDAAIKAEADQKIIEIDGHKYTWNRNNYCYSLIKPVIPDDPIFPDPLTFFTLNGLVDYINENTENIIPTDGTTFILQVVDEKTVILLTHPSEHRKVRHIVAKATAHTPDIRFGVYMDSESFNTQILSKFIQTEARQTLFSVVKSMTKQQDCNTTDDGVSQVITVKQGVTMASNVTFQNPVPLKPMRTFAEIDQPESNFTFRINNDSGSALFEADGGAWKLEAVEKIADYLKHRVQNSAVKVIA